MWSRWRLHLIKWDYHWQYQFTLTSNLRLSQKSKHSPIGPISVRADDQQLSRRDEASVYLSLVTLSTEWVHKPGLLTTSDRIIRRQFTGPNSVTTFSVLSQPQPPIRLVPLNERMSFVWDGAGDRGCEGIVKWGLLLCSVNRKRLTFAEHLCDTRSTI